MGLDWCLKSTKAGVVPLEMLGAERCNPDNPEHLKICRRIIKSHVDNFNDALWHEHSNEYYKEYWSRSEAEIFEDMKGSILVDTVDTERFKDVLPALGSPFSSMSGVETYRGKRVQYCELIPQDLREEAFSDMSNEEMADYANRLEKYIPEDPDIGIHDRETLVSAVAWLRFWSVHPVRLHAWY